jgi:hypothetical protein
MASSIELNNFYGQAYCLKKTIPADDGSILVSNNTEFALLVGRVAFEMCGHAMVGVSL